MNNRLVGKMKKVFLNGEVQLKERLLRRICGLVLLVR